ncbi:MAG: ComF family protein [Cyclobacteriaceae bacterium]|nr:ComF family protein [Cyclobacteriaceae bacterium]
MKYNHHPEVGFRLGKAFGREMELAGMNQFDLIIPVPLHPGRERQRGFNQSVMIARGIGEVIGKPVEEHISVRSKRTATQTTKTRMKRWENVRTVFAVLTPERLKGKSVLLVDDVITTGATLEACAGHLLEAGCSSLSIACLAEAR